MISRIRQLAHRMLSLPRRKALDRRLEDEIQGHLDMVADEYVRRGMDPKEARLAARRDFGGVTAIAQQYREERGLPLLETTWQDLRLAFRSLLKNRTFAALAILSFGLGIGANTAIFSVLEAVLLRPLPFMQPERLVILFESVKGGRVGVSIPNLEDWRLGNQTFADLSAFTAQTMSLTRGDRAERVRGGFISPGFFSILGVKPAVGRITYAQGERAAIIDHTLWEQHFQSDAAAVGRNIILNGEAFTIAGVLPGAFAFRSTR